MNHPLAGPMSATTTPILKACSERASTARSTRPTGLRTFRRRVTGALNSCNGTTLSTITAASTSSPPISATIVTGKRSPGSAKPSLKLPRLPTPKGGMAGRHGTGKPQIWCISIALTFESRSERANMATRLPHGESFFLFATQKVGLFMSLPGRFTTLPHPSLVGIPYPHAGVVF